MRLARKVCATRRPNATAEMPHFPRMLKKTFVDGYDYLQLVVFGNVIWCLAWTPAAAFATARIGNFPLKAAVVLLLASVGAGPVWMGLAQLSRAIADREDPRMAQLLTGLRAFFGRGVALFLVNVAFIAVCLFDVWWWSTFTRQRWSQLASFVVTTLWVYVLLFWLIMQAFCAPFIVRENIGVARALRKSALLVLDNLGYATMVMLQIAVLMAIMSLWIVVPGQAKATLMGLALMVLFFLFAGFVSLLGTEALDDLMQKYQPAQDSEEEGAGEEEKVRS